MIWLCSEGTKKNNSHGKPIKLSSDAPKNANVKIMFSDESRKALLDN